MTTDQPTTEKKIHQLSAQEFINIITEVVDKEKKEEYAKFYRVSSFGNEIIIEDVEINEEVKLTDHVTVNLPLVIKSGSFKGDFKIEGIKFSKDFKIEGGTFDGNFSVQRSTFSGSFSIHGGTFNGNFQIHNGTFEGNLVIYSGTFSRDFKIDGDTSGIGFTIRGGVFSGDFSIDNGTFSGTFQIDSGAFNGNFLISDGKFKGDFVVRSGTFSQIFRISGGTFSQTFRISGGTFNQTFKISGGTFTKELIIEGGTFTKEIIIKKENAVEENYVKEGFINTLKIGSLASAILLRVEESCHLNNLLIDGILPVGSLLHVSGKLYSLTFKDVQNFGTVVLTGLSSREDKSLPKDVALPNDTDPPGTAQLQIVNSDLGKTTFIGCDLSGFGLDFKSSKITDVFVTGTQMPKEITTTDDSTGKPDYRQQQLGYSQIKKIYEARGDRVEANRYYAREMDAYLFALSWRNDFWEKLNLGLNKFSTNHGQSWQQGLLTTLGVGGLFYIFYCGLLGFGLAWPTEDGAWARLGEVWSYFLEFINPIHKADYVAEELLKKQSLTEKLIKIEDKTPVNINGWARTVEGISRIFIAYFVYQLIQAFRKHGRSSG